MDGDGAIRGHREKDIQNDRVKTWTKMFFHRRFFTMFSKVKIFGSEGIFNS